MNEYETEAMLAALTARLMAIDSVLHTLIATHPDPVSAHGVWQTVVLEPVNQDLEAPSIPAFRDALHRDLARWSRAFEGALPQK